MFEKALLTDDEIKEELKKYFTEEQLTFPEPEADLVCGIIAIVRKATLKAVLRELDAINKDTSDCISFDRRIVMFMCELRKASEE